jgi:hypothetical protein
VLTSTNVGIEAIRKRAIRLPYVSGQAPLVLDLGLSKEALEAQQCAPSVYVDSLYEMHSCVPYLGIVK